MEPVNLTNLRSMTDGDRDMEKELFKEFVSSFDGGLNLLRENCDDGAAETWRKEAHGLKGIALNLGAETLGGLCKQGQDGYRGDKASKEKLLQAIGEEYTKVKTFLQNM